MSLAKMSFHKLDVFYESKYWNVIKALNLAIKIRFTSEPMIQQLDRELQYCSTIHPNKPV